MKAIKRMVQAVLHFVKWESPQALMRAAKAARNPLETGQDPKRQTRYTYTEGPMMFLGQQIVRAMQDAGYPAKIVECYRSPERQAELYFARPQVTKAAPGQSPHQFYEAVDIAHPAHGWAVSPQYWETLATCVRIVSDKYGVQLVHGHNWRFKDSAHIETPDWKQERQRYITGEDGGQYLPIRKPTEAELAERFQRLLPRVWAQAQK